MTEFKTITEKEILYRALQETFSLLRDVKKKNETYVRVCGHDSTNYMSFINELNAQVDEIRDRILKIEEMEREGK